MHFVLLAIPILTLFFLSLSLVLSIDLFRVERDFSALHYLVTVLLLFIWLAEFTLSPFLLGWYPENAPRIIDITVKLQIIGMLGGIGAALMIDQPFYNRYARIFSRISIGSFSGAITLLISDYFADVPSFFTIQKEGEKYIAQFHVLYSILTFMASGFLALGFAVAIGAHIRSEEFSYSMNKIILSWVVGIIGFATPSVIMLFALTDSTPSVELLQMTWILGVISFVILLFTLFSFEMPTLNIFGGIRPRKMLEKGYLGYVIGIMTEEGPKMSAFAKPFSKNVAADEGQMEAFVIMSMSILGGNNQEWEGSYLIPFPLARGYETIAIMFSFENPAAQDERLRKNTPVFFSLIIPRNFTLVLHDLDLARKYIISHAREILAQKKDPNQSKRIEEIVLNVARQILA